MNNTIIKNIEIKDNRASADILVNGEYNNIWYEYPEKLNANKIRPANAFLILTMPIAMTMSKNIIVEGTISKSLLEKMTTYQEILTKWYPNLNKINIQATNIEEDLSFEATKRKTICCFTGGADSFHSVLKNLNDIDDLLYVWGFDIPLTEENFYNKVVGNLKKAAKELKKDLILIKTNVGYEFTNKYASWGDLCHGPAIASSILLMEDKYSRSIIPSSNDYANLCPRGSHILTNYLWGCDNLTFEYDGAECTRIEKIDIIADSPVVSKYLRVCYLSNNEYNCGKCEKCLRTMTSLEAVGKLHKIKAFNDKAINYQDFYNIELLIEPEYGMAKDTLKYLIKNNSNQKELIDGLKYQICQYEVKQFSNLLLDNFDVFLKSNYSKDICDKVIDYRINDDTKRITKKVLKVFIKKLFNKKYRHK